MSLRAGDDAPHGGHEAEPSEATRGTWKSTWSNNKGLIFITLAQAIASSMDAIVRFLQQGEHKMHPFQIIFARMGMTFVLSSLYMWWTKVPDFPLGRADVRGWLVVRALFGFFGLFYSVHYLPLAEATVFRFLVPIVTAWACSIFLGEIFSSRDLLAGLVALIGVTFIAQPSSLFGPAGNDDIQGPRPSDIDHVSPTQRLLAIAASLLGVLGASGAYTMIRVIGTRAHALISVNYFAVLGTVGSAGALLIVPGMSFTMPHGAREWVLVVLLGVLGFALQFLLTAGLQLDRSSKATSMLYTQVLFALSFDFAIWGVLPGGWSLFGGAIVIASTLWSALSKPSKPSATPAKKAVVDEESALLGGQREEEVVETAQRRASISI
ncbi:hypothetical protein V502_01415 [Pseudogymnoascus sp. VKM F-4520 (FW-2644)]|nr:hypothetical protein V502_01415 [Pseudogymnoascus sp. VKM F-4520 (FW-2644)]